MELIQKVVGYVIFGVSVLLIAIMLYSGAYVGNEDSATNLGLNTTYVLSILAIGGIVVGFVMTAITNPAAILRTAIGLVVMAILWGISYGMAGNEVTDIYKEFHVDAALSKTIGSVLTLTYSLLVLASVGIVFTEVSGALK